MITIYTCNTVVFNRYWPYKQTYTCASVLNTSQQLYNGVAVAAKAWPRNRLNNGTAGLATLPRHLVHTPNTRRFRWLTENMAGVRHMQRIRSVQKVVASSSRGNFFKSN